MQNIAEHTWFCELLRRESVKSYLEIGSKWGGSLRLVAASLPPGSKIVSVDLPNGASYEDLPKSRKALLATMKEMHKLGYDAHLILGNSRDQDTVERVRSRGPYDCVFIDADHHLPGVTADWENYGPMCRLVAFHDIGYRRPDLPPDTYKSISVPELWEKIKGSYRHEEIRLEEQRNGIGVIWR